jgi:nucleoside-diphosphate-sugar epimerase
MRFVVTGGMGFFGSFLADYLVADGHEVVSVDRLPDDRSQKTYENIQLDITDGAAFQSALKKQGNIDAILHVAALLAHDKENLHHLWDSNVKGTENVIAGARALNIGKVVFTSTNCVFSTGFEKPVDENTPTHPIEIYGKSKLAAEALLTAATDVSSIIIRCPTIIAAGRLGLLTILFDFVREGRCLYVVGDGSNRYSFIAAQDLANACFLASQSKQTGIYHIGSDNVPTMKELYQDVMVHCGKEPRIRCLPNGLTQEALKVLNALRLSPLGPYHYRMIAANFVFDNSKLKRDLNWKPTLTNSEILIEAYKYYVAHLSEIKGRKDVSAHKTGVKAGVLNLLRLIS